MDREYLEDYEQRENDEFERLVKRRIREGTFTFEKDKYPPDERFVNLQKPVASAARGTTKTRNLWAQVPFCNSLILALAPASKPIFEEIYFNTSEIPKVIDFIKDTGRLQVALNTSPTSYEGLDHFDPFFKELNPPVFWLAPSSILGTEKELNESRETFMSLASVRYIEFLHNLSQQVSSRTFAAVLASSLSVYDTLKLGHYTLGEDIENLLIDDPGKALLLFNICYNFIALPSRDLRFDIRNSIMEEIRAVQDLPLVYQPQEIRFPCEIGKFLLKRLTYAPTDLRACNELIDEYDAYDLQKVAESLNDAIITNHSDPINKSAEELSEILENVWNDPTIPRRVKGLEIGIPLSMAAIGSVAAGPIGAAGGFLAGLGFNVAHKFLDVEAAGLSEKIAKLRTKSYQANIYDFKRKYKAKIAH